MKTSIGKTFAAPLAVLVLASFALAPAADARDGGGRGGGGGGGGASARASGGGGGSGARASGGGRQVDSTKVDARANNVRGTSVNNVNNVNRNTNVNANRNVNVNVQGNSGCCGGGWDNDYHPVATAAAVTATVAVTSAVIGSIVNRPPANCVPVNYAGMIYQQCGSTWYQPQGSQYVVVNPPY
jgi:hypothetical protein